jgi:glycosyltransferase involved in cell wall biosynthesis
MRVLLSDTTFSYLYPGGKQVMAVRLVENLRLLGVQADFENWHDPKLDPDVVHVMGFNDVGNLRELKRRGKRLVFTHILDWITNSGERAIRRKEWSNRAVRMLPSQFDRFFPWRAIPLFDAVCYMNQGDRDTGIRLYNLDPARTHVIRLGVEDIQSYRAVPDGGPVEGIPERYLVSVASIVPRKNQLFLARACRAAGVPVVFVGHPGNEQGDYFQEFNALVDSKVVFYFRDAPEALKRRLLWNASGFVLLSLGESGCIVVSEAGATGLPILLADLPWAKDYEDPHGIRYASAFDQAAAAREISQFYELARRGDTPSFRVRTWREVAEMYCDVYREVLGSATTSSEAPAGLRGDAER